MFGTGWARSLCLVWRRRFTEKADGKETGPKSAFALHEPGMFSNTDVNDILVCILSVFGGFVLVLNWRVREVEDIIWGSNCDTE
jgi:hypothetical protein